MKKVVFMSVLAMLSACGRSVHDQQIQALNTTQSWIATAEMVGQAWQQGTVPDHYAQRTLTRSQQEITQETRHISYPPAVIRQAQHTIQHMVHDVEQGDKAAIATDLQHIATEHHQIQTFIQTQDSSP